jgi:CheY-like chemotaxis protein
MANILLVDDDQLAIAANTAALKANGHSVAAVSSTADAVAAVSHDMPDLVVLEAMLDGAYGGFDLARSLASSYPDLPMIMLTRADEHLTGKERSAQDRDGGWIPVQRFMEKPVAPAVLVYEAEHLLPGAH